jgi:DNA-cytosine methyltransferase
MNVLSLFDGMSCGQIALKELGIKVDNYYSSEIDKYAIQQTQHNFPDTIQLGDIEKWREWDIDFSSIDLIVAGSPCQGFSFAGKQLAFDDPRSKLFFIFVEILNHTKKLNPNVKFLLENVRMKKEHLRIMSEYVGIFPCDINSNLVSAQKRFRYYWTNIRTKKVGLFDELYTDIPQPKDRGILLKDILETNVADKYFLSDKMINYFQNKAANFNNGKVNIRDKDEKATTITASSSSISISDNFVLDTALKMKANQGKSNCFTAGGNSGGLHSDMDIICVAMRGRKNGQELEMQLSGKTNCLTPVAKDNLVMTQNYVQLTDGFASDNRFFYEDGKHGSVLTKGADKTGVLIIPEATSKGYAEIKPGECVDLENPNSKTRRWRKLETKSNCLMSSTTQQYKYTEDYKLRRLTPLECARLQTIPEWYKWIVSDTQQYRMLGNGWTIEIIKEIFKYIK